MIQSVKEHKDQTAEGLNLTEFEHLLFSKDSSFEVDPKLLKPMTYSDKAKTVSTK